MKKMYYYYYYYYYYHHFVITGIRTNEPFVETLEVIQSNPGYEKRNYRSNDKTSPEDRSRFKLTKCYAKQAI